MRDRLPELVLLGVTIVWGGTFLVTQRALADAGPFLIVGMRFGIGALILALLFRRRLPGMTRDEWIGGAVVGGVTFISFASQTAGLQYIPSSTSAFITALYVPIVPILQLVLLRHTPRLAAWLGIAICFAGLMVLSWDGEGIALGLGEGLTLISAVSAAFQIVLISRWVEQADPMRLATVQMAVVSLLSFVAAALTAEPLQPPTWSLVLAVLALGSLGSAFAIGAMNWAQKRISATRATILYTMEPVWAGIFGALAGEVITGSTLVGSMMILTGVLIGEIRWREVRTEEGEMERTAGGVESV